MASLTKIMTMFTVLQLIDQLKVSDTDPIVIDEEMSSVTGTTANLLAGDTLTIRQLMYGMMLPSGNDAAHALSKHFGTLLLRAKKE